MTTKNEISAWFDEGLNNPDKPTHMIIVCDTYDHEDYPVYVLPTENVHQVYKNKDGNNMQRVTEVYKLTEDKEKQINQSRCFNF
jgi:hypothetical protein